MNLTIVGLGAVGTSLGLALKATGAEIAVVGHDPDTPRAVRAKKLDAIDKSHWNLISACSRADLILLDLPLEAIQGTFQALKGETKESAVIIDTAPVKRPVLEWAARILPETTQFVGGHVMCSSSALGVAKPSAELLKGATFFLVAPEKVEPWALEVASNLAQAVGAQPCYIDASEHDGLIAAIRQLPVVCALALADLMAAEPGAKDRIRLAGGEWCAVRAALANLPDGTASAIAANAENVIRLLGAYGHKLSELHQILSEGNGQQLEQKLTKAVEAPPTSPSRGPAARTESASQEAGRLWRGMFLGEWLSRRPRQADRRSSRE